MASREHVGLIGPEGHNGLTASAEDALAVEPKGSERVGLGLLPLLILFATTRFLAIILLRPGGYFGDWTDYSYFREMAALSAQGYYPYVHYWVEYPPLFPWLLVAAYQLSLLLPPFTNPMLWFQGSLSCLLLLADAGNLWLVWRIGARLWGKARAYECAALYAGLFLPLYALSAWFDTLTVFCLLLGLELLLQRRAALAGLACGAGIAVKLFPVLLIPIGVRALRSVRSWVALVVAALVVPALTFVPFYFLGRDMLVASLHGILNRHSWESIWALIDGYYGTGIVPSLKDRLLYTPSALWENPSRTPWTLVTVVFAVLYLAVWWRAGVVKGAVQSGARGGAVGRLLRSVFGASRPEMSPRSIVALCGFTVVVFLLYNKGFSPQFTLMLLPFVILLAPTTLGVLYSVLLVLNNTFVEGYLWVNVFPDDHWLLRAIVGMRTLLFLIFAVETASVLIPRLALPWRRVKPALAWCIALATVALGVLGVVHFGGEYWARSAAQSPRAAAIESLAASAPDAALLFGDQALMESMAPYAQPRPSLLLADPKLPDRVGPLSLHSRLVDFTSGHSEVLLVEETGRPASRVTDEARRWLSRNYVPAGESTEAGVRIQRYDARPSRAFAAPAVFGQAIALDWAEIPPKLKPGDVLPVFLDWRSLQAVDRDYTVYAHFLDAQGKTVAQKDMQPVDAHYPTSLWKPGERVVDQLDIAIPPSLPPGQYTVAVGLYFQPTLERLTAKGGPANEDQVLVGPITVGAGQ